MVTRWLWLWGLSSATGSAAITVTVLLVFSSVNTHCPPDRRFGQPVMLSDPAGEDSQPVPVRNRIGQCCGGSTLGSIVHGPRQHLRDEDVKSRNGSRPQTRPWRERAQGGSRSRSSGGALVAVMEPPDLRHGDDPATGRGFDHSWVGTVVVERLVRSCGVVVSDLGAVSFGKASRIWRAVRTAVG
jgi:hypothetical protein